MLEKMNRQWVLYPTLYVCSEMGRVNAIVEENSMEMGPAHSMANAPEIEVEIVLSPKYQL